MAMNNDPKVVYEFGPFRMDPDKQVLLRENQPIPITPKAFETLLVLVRRSREVVTREELLQAVWPDSFVEEANLSQNIFMLRKALGDTLEERCYIVTLPGRGYRFAAPVQTITETGDALIAQMRSRTEILIEQPAQETVNVPPPFPPALSAPTRRSRKWVWPAIICAAFGLAVVAALLLLLRHSSASLNAKDSVLVAEFANLTGDSVFDHVLRQGLQVQLEQSPYLSLLSEDRIQHSLRLMGQASDTRLAGPVAREVCVRSGAEAMLEGSIQTVGSQYLLNLSATNCRNGDVIDQEQAQVARKEDVLGAVSRLTSRFRQRAGESPATLEKHDLPLAEATTGSLDALKAYSLGLNASAIQGDEAGIPYFKRAVELDPKFAMANAYLALMYGSTGSSELASAYARKAYDLRDRASDNERFFISAYYFGRATGNQEKARQICEEWAATYPRDPLPHAFLSGFIYLVLANYDKAIEEARKGIELAPDHGFFYVDLGENSLYVGLLNNSEEALRKAGEHKIENPMLLVLQYDLAFTKQDHARIQQAVEAAQGRPDSMDWIADRQAFASAYAGQLQKAEALSRQAIELARQQGDPERAAVFAVRAALWEAFFGNPGNAKQGAGAALALARNREVAYGAAVALALAGDTLQAETLAANLERSYPDDTSVRFSYLPVIRAIVALQRGDPASAIGILEITSPYELGTPRSACTGYFGSLYPILIRGQAYLAARRGPEAAREFRKLIDHHDIMIGDPVSSLAPYLLARSYLLLGDKVKARAQFEQALTMWKDADSDFSILNRLKRDYADLR